MTLPHDTETIVDFVTGRRLPLVGAEENRQAVERHLVENKGFAPAEIIVDAPIAMSIDGDEYRSTVDLVVQLDGRPLMVVKCAAGSLGSRERETLSAARLLAPVQIPLSVVSDGTDAIVLETETGRRTGTGMKDIPTRGALVEFASSHDPVPLAEDRRQREQLIFRSYDSMNVNRYREKH